MDVVSVIVPFYNGNKHLPNLKSVLENNALAVKDDGVKLELVLVNDSPWVEVEKDIIESDGYEFILINLPANGGIHNARVEGLKKSTGKYVAFLDQDDIWNDLFVRETYRCFQREINEKVGCVIANGVFQTSSGDKKILNSSGRVFFAKKHQSYFVLGNFLSSPGQCLLKKDAIPEFWTQNIMKTNCSDDLFLWMLMFNNSGVEYCNKLLYTHVNTGENFSLDREKGVKSDCEVLSLISNNKNTSRVLVGIFKWRCNYNLKKLGLADCGLVGYYSYAFLQISFKVLMKVVSLVCKFED